ncbi:VWA domain-containing protein [Persicimonas caeni]|uniref:VWA domain-containing protein n=1 Tax=Persicimonas caeni TaxID=2292766 RepID=A0A4Y6Q0N2_PERCE|nr:BatA and WFA domain-containing protein [Persicimonas caeni]QDG54124.1 VWA domain-containing protein [Persicimonas caeni]QED35345.1 VWA domain-containing protein [Persicimonas caeni]
MQFTGLPISTILTIAGVVAAGVTVLYILKLRKRRIQVPFSHLWGRVLEKKRRQSDFWRKFRRFLSWLLHILMAALIAFALADPHLEEEEVRGRHILLLVDNSASMAATDVSGGADRMDVARQKALEILETVGAEDRIMLVAFNDQIQPLSPFVAEASIIEQPLRQIKTTATGTSYKDALGFAADSLRDTSNGHLVLISDGSGLSEETFEEFDFGEGTKLTHLKIGESSGNVAVTAFNVRRYVANKLDYELFVQVKNYFDRAVEAELQIHADGRLVDTKPLSLQPGETMQRFYPSQAVSGEKLEARVRLTSRDARDVFPLDDRAFAMLPSIRKVRVLAVSDGNLFLEGPLLLNPNLEVERIKPDQYTPDRSKGFDVTIFDSVAPALPQEGNFVFFDPPAEGSPWEQRGDIDDPIITAVKDSHPLMRWITLKDLNIGAATSWRTGRWDSTVAASFGKPLIVTRKRDNLNLIGVAFDIRNSDMPLRVAFPVFMINVVDYFTLDDDSYIPNYTTGDTWAVDVAKGADKATVTTPTGEQTEVPVYNGRAVFNGDQTGFYTVATADETKTIAANLSNLRESRIAPGDLELGKAKVDQDADSLIFERNELWIWAILALVLLLLIEWATYNRRVTV